MVLKRCRILDRSLQTVSFQDNDGGNNSVPLLSPRPQSDDILGSQQKHSTGIADDTDGAGAMMFLKSRARRMGPII
jgi:hypothetical protein